MSSFLCLVGFSTYIVYYFFMNTGNKCYHHIEGGVIALAILYPIEGILIYICVLGSAAIS